MRTQPFPRPRAVLALAAALPLLAATLSCADAAGPGVDPTAWRGHREPEAPPVALPPEAIYARVAEVDAQPDSLRFDALGQAAQLQARPVDHRGEGVEGAVVAWSSLDPGVAAVDSTGSVTPLTNGATAVVASAGRHADTVPVTVRQVVVSVDVVPTGAALLLPGDTVQLRARAADANGFAVADAVFAWSSSSPAIATVDGDGLVRVNAEGEAVLTAAPARDGSGSDSARVVAGSVVSMGAGGLSCAVLAAGAAYCWGSRNVWGELGTGDLRVRTGPVAGGHRFRSISVGDRHVCALTTEDQAYCWGRDEEGQVGGWGCERFILCSPVPIPTFGADRYTSVSAGATISCALRADGQVRCAGWAQGFQQPEPFTHITTSVGMCGLTADGTAHCGSAFPRFVPFTFNPPVEGLRFRSLQASFGTHACGIATDGETYCRGENGFGQLGDGTFTSSQEPRRVAGGHRFVSVAPGQGVTCALDEAGQTYCWGDRAASAFGADASGQVCGVHDCRDTPAPVRQAPRFSALSMRGAHACGISEGAMYCWGHNSGGALSVGSSEPVVPAPRRVRLVW